MEHYAGIDVSLEQSSLCVVDAQCTIVKETKVASEPEALGDFFGVLGIAVKQIGLEAGPLSQWLHAGLKGPPLGAVAECARDASYVLTQQHYLHRPTLLLN
jgi:transposase